MAKRYRTTAARLRGPSMRLSCGHAPPSPGNVVGLSKQRSEDAHDAQEDDDPDNDDGDQKEDQEPKATAVTLTHYHHLWRWWGCLTHSESLSASVNRLSTRQCLFVAGWRATQSWQTVIRVITRLRPWKIAATRLLDFAARRPQSARSTRKRRAGLDQKLMAAGE
jgi:hypothetical protein